MKQTDIHRETVCQITSAMTSGLLAKDGTNHGTLVWHYQHR